MRYSAEIWCLGKRSNMIPRAFFWLLLCISFSHLSWAAKVRETLRLSWGVGAPNGHSREMIFTNGQFPGPNLVFNEDDDVEVGTDSL